MISLELFFLYIAVIINIGNCNYYIIFNDFLFWFDLTCVIVACELQLCEQVWYKSPENRIWFTPDHKPYGIIIFQKKTRTSHYELTATNWA